MTAARLIACLALLACAGAAGAAGPRTENLFGAIHIDGKKAGQIHYTVEYGDGGDVETLHTRASLSILGVKLFNFDQTLHETWQRGELRRLHGRTDDNGKSYDAVLERGPGGYTDRRFHDGVAIVPFGYYAPHYYGYPPTAFDTYCNQLSPYYDPQVCWDYYYGYGG